MAYSVFAAVLSLFTVITLYLSYYFGQWKNQPVVCTVSYTIGWLISLLFVGVLPIDISSINNITDQNSGSLSVFVDMQSLHVFWTVVYWASQLLTWIILPIMESYAGSGEFTIMRKFRSAIIDNAVIYGSYLILFICVLIYLLVKRTVSFDAASVKVLLITTSNTWGLFLVVFFLGYGLVEVPRAVLRAASPITRLRFGYFSLSKRYLEYIEDEEELKMVLAVSLFLTKLTVCPALYRLDTSTSPPFFLHSSRVFEHGPTPAVLGTRGSPSSVLSLWQRLVGANSRVSSLEWYWRCRIYPLLLRALGTLLGVVSLIIVWSECTFFVREPLFSLMSPFSVPTFKLKWLVFFSSLQFVSFVFLGYLGFCVYFTAYRLRFFNYYRLVPNHHSDAISLIFYGYMLCRLTPSLCVNFLCLAHLDSHVLFSSTAFTKFMGHLDVVPFIANGFNVYFPIIVVLLCLVTFFSLGSRLLTSLGMPQLIGPSFIDKRLNQHSSKSKKLGFWVCEVLEFITFYLALS
ncbi:unnamed protein product [Taenia asiatica]|uniref:LMBR1-like membrane protein n=1 Tax=Taenia asiatica TaxID=60517 RepID=A0A0R3WCZ0_TAEAS|nr:unnamed protein product [Taenia asiatica]